VKSTDQNDKHAVRVNGAELWSDRVSLAKTEEAFIALVGDDSLSLSTLQRAERGEKVQLGKLRLMADVLGRPVDSYIHAGTALKPRTSCNLAGEWTGYYMEPDIDHAPTLVETTLEIKQRGSALSLRLREDGSDGEERIEAVIDAFVYDHLVHIFTCVENWKAPWGLASTMLTVELGEDVLRGWAHWLDKDTGRIEASPITYVRRGCYMYDEYVQRAIS